VATSRKSNRPSVYITPAARPNSNH